MPIPMVDLKREQEFLGTETLHAIQSVMEHGRYINGPEVGKLEEALRERIGVSHAVGCGNGTDALQIALMTLNIGPGDEVITTPFTFAATVEVIALLGATPVFVDIDPDTFLMNLDQIEAKITPATKAILPVHLFGQMVDMGQLMNLAEKHGLKVVEDMAQAIDAEFDGVPAGSRGDLACTSFFPSKNLGAYGDGGMVFSRDEELGARAHMIRNHGQKIRYTHHIIGVNSRLDSVQAAVLLTKLPHLSEWTSRRQAVAALYDRLLPEHVQTPARAAGSTHVFHQYSVLVNDRDAVRARLEEQGIASAIHYPIPLNEQPAFQYLKAQKQTPVARSVAARIMALPMSPWISDQEVEQVAEALK